MLAWGSNTEGQLGLGEPGPDHCYTEGARYPRFELCDERPLPVLWTNPATGRSEELSGVRSLAAGDFSTYAILQGGHLLSWGGNHKGELGTGAETVHGDELPPSEVRRSTGAPLSGVVEVAAGFDFALARLADGEVLGWGSDEQGALAGLPGEECGHSLGRGAKGPLHPCVRFATRIPALERLHPEALSAGKHFGLALAAGAVYAWGNNERGELGSGEGRRGKFKHPGHWKRRAGTSNPVRVSGFGPAAMIAAGGTHAVAVLQSSAAVPPPLLAAAPEPLELALSWQSAHLDGRGSDRARTVALPRLRTRG